MGSIPPFLTSDPVNQTKVSEKRNENEEEKVEIKWKIIDGRGINKRQINIRKELHKNVSIKQQTKRSSSLTSEVIDVSMRCFSDALRN